MLPKFSWATLGHFWDMSGCGKGFRGQAGPEEAQTGLLRANRLFEGPALPTRPLPTSSFQS